MENETSGTLIIDGLNTSALDRDQLARLRRGGVRAFHWTVARAQAGWDEVIASIESAWERVEALGGEVVVVGSAQDLRRVVAEGRVAVIFGLQDTRALETDLSRVGTLRRLGLRVLQLTYNERNFVGDGCAEPANAGLSLFGRRLVAELNAAGILIDVSHCGRQTTLDAVALSRVPVAITHANARALCDTPRNKTDAEIRAVSEAGGIVGVVFWSPLSGAAQRPTLEAIMKHLAHIVKLGGTGAPRSGAIGARACSAVRPSGSGISSSVRSCTRPSPPTWVTGTALRPAMSKGSRALRSSRIWRGRCTRRGSRTRRSRGRWARTSSGSSARRAGDDRRPDRHQHRRARDV